MTSKNVLKAILLTATSIALFSAPTSFAADTGAFSKFSSAAPTSTVTVDYTPIKQFSTAFGRTERGRTKIAYAAAEERGKNFLSVYMRRLSRVQVASLSRNDQLAYWLNTHNMLVMQAMTDSDARRNMSKARGTADAPGEMWTKKRITVQGTELSLHDIEKNIILANFTDKPNAIFGLYQGTKGSPAFMGDGFTGADLDAQLASAGKSYLKSQLKVKGSTAKIPAVLDWYKDDLFGGDQDALKAQLVSLSSAKNAKKLSSVTNFEPRKFSYSSDELIIRQQVAYDGGSGNLGNNDGGGRDSGGGS